MQNQNQAFTLIELLIVVALIGVIVGIAIVQLAGYTAGSYDARAKSDLRNAANAEEAYFVQSSEYVACANVAQCETRLPQFSASSGTNMAISLLGTTGFVGTASNDRGTNGLVYTWNSVQGGMQ
ncbi:MAG: prepilin-type N-terminal cleavage/methylation domain-containing protein [Bdellovibrionales bacterium]|nr:prepilin-type N-terminal cleavage/methylation domain-containing protein [Bdellovibrionales bacterium]